MFLLDTNVVSELRKAHAGKADRKVTAWAEGVPAACLYLSVISILELELGVLLSERRDHEQGRLLRQWLDHRVLPAFSSRMLVVDVSVAQRRARLHVPDRCSERDALIAATALVHRLTVVTRNVADFAATGVDLLDPWET
jgi:hypothetical protein